MQHRLRHSGDLGNRIGGSSSSWSSYWNTLISATVENAAPTKVILTFSKANISLVTTDFTIAGKTITLLERDATNKILTLTVSVAFVYGDTPVVTFVKTGGTANVTNNVVQLPVYVSSVIADATPTILEMTYNLVLTNIVPATSAFAVLVNAVARTVNSVAIVGGKVQLTLASAIIYNDVVTVAYTKPATNPKQTTAGGLAISITAQSVTNNVVGIGFLTEWTVSGDTTARTITLPLIQNRTEGALAYNCIVDWGDGTATSTVTTYNDANRIHTYASNGTYQVKITGTMEGWSFNNGGDKLKITKVVNWGVSGVFNGFKYLLGGFYGCTNLTSIGTGKILASGTGVLTQGFYQTFYGCKFTTIPTGLFDNHTALTTQSFFQTFTNCNLITAIPVDLFRYNTLVTTNVFNGTFYGCSSITTIPTDLFRYNTLITTSAFTTTFFGCTSLTEIPTDLFRYNTEVSTSGFYQTFRSCTPLTVIPTDLFRYNTKVSTSGFYDTFQSDINITSIPVDLFRYNTLVSSQGFEGTFIQTGITTLPADLFKYNTLVGQGGFQVTFQTCANLQTLPANLFRYNVSTALYGFVQTFEGCVKLQLRADIFYADGEQATRFLNTLSSFTNCFNRATFTGTQGVAPDLWNCTYPTKLEVSINPATAWVPGDTITGQSSGVTSVLIVRWTTWIWLVTTPSGNYTSGEIIGVTGVPAKLADQAAGYPTQVSALVNTDCFNGAGNSLTSISNYGDIPAPWL